MHIDNFRQKLEYSMHFYVVGTVHYSHIITLVACSLFASSPLAVSLLDSLCHPFYRKVII